MASKSGSGLVAVLPYVAVGGLLYLMIKNSGKLKASSAGAAALPPAQAGSVGNNCGANDFGATAGCWCG